MAGLLRKIATFPLKAAIDPEVHLQPLVNPPYRLMKGAGSVALKTGRSAGGVGKSLWKAPTWAKGLALVTGAVSATVAARAFTESSYAAEDHAESDGMGGYQPVSGVRERMNRIGGGGDLVFGLHARRH